LEHWAPRFRARVRYVSRAISVRAEERADERIRIARELHDTLLQGVQGLLLTFHVAAEKVPADHESKKTLEKALATADRIILEGRNRVSRLRSEHLSDEELRASIETFANVFAVIMTIMVFNIKVPQSSGFPGLVAALPALLSYVLSFLYVGIYWNNHHHLLQASESVSGRILWANLHLLFWLSLAPFATAWMGQNHLAPAPVAFYGFILLFSGIAYFILTKSLVAHHRKDSALAISVGNDRKGRLRIAVYAFAIPVAFVRTWAAYLCYVLVAVMWLLPDPRIEKVVRE
jgi:uncharacterized membrane protein